MIHPSLVLIKTVRCLVVVWLVLCLPRAAAGQRDLCGDGYGDFVSSGEGFGVGSLDGRSDLEDICSDGSGPFCFPSTLRGFVDKEDWGMRGSSRFRMANGAVVSCFLKDSSKSKNNEEQIATCKAPPVADDWTHATGNTDEISEEIETGSFYGSSQPRIDISPPLLEWRRAALYSPSSVLLRVANLHNDSVLFVHDMFSTNPQFYAYDFEKITLGPGESVSINFVFLPRWLGSSAAHLVMQTNFGGFIIEAKGVAIESPYQLEPLLDGNMNWNFSLYNPFANVLLVKEVTARLSVSFGDIHDSAHVVCRLNASRQSSDEFPTDKMRLTVKSGEFGLPWANIKPYAQWEVPPYSALTIAGMHMWSQLEGSVSGSVCLQLWDTKSNRADTVIVPIKMDPPSRKLSRDSAGSLSVFLEPLVPCEGRELIFSVSAINKASYLLSVVKVSVLMEGSKLFRVNYMKGLILYPRSVSQIALISYTRDSNMNTFEASSFNIKCEIFIVTNDSASSEIKIPCQNFDRSCSEYQYGSSNVVSEGSYIGMTLQQEKEKSTGTHTGPLETSFEEPLTNKPKLLEVAKVDELILRNWRSQGTMENMSVFQDREVLFPAVQIGTSSSKWISVHNPSKQPVIMQLVLNSGVIVDQCKSDELSEHTLLNMFGHVDSKEIQDGFSLADSARTEAFVQPLSSAFFGPVVFRPSKRCMWRSSALIRSNLSGVEWLPLRAFGGSPSLELLEGSIPVRKLEFNFDLPVSMNMSSWNILPHNEKNSSCGHLISKELYAKNTGELPLEVSKMDVSGSTCGLGGFMIHNCKGFALGPGESRKLLISYRADFSSAVVHRELELAMASGIIVIPMKAVLPVYMLKICRKSFFRSTLWVLSTLLLAIAFITCLVILRTSTHVSSSGAEYYYIKNDKSITTIGTVAKRSRPHRNTKSNSRFTGEDEDPDVIYISGHPSCPNSANSNTERMQSRQETNILNGTTVSVPFSTNKPVGVLIPSDIIESPSHAADLTVRVVTERSRRRKRRASGATSAARFDVSGSQSGNSTPSSPLSPNASTLKQIWSLSTNTDNLDSQVPDDTNQQSHDTEHAMGVRAPQAERQYDGNWLQSAESRPHVAMKSTGRPTLLSSATFPSHSLCAPGVAVPNILGSTSPIALHARAPGSKLSKDDSSRREGNNVPVKEFTYDIWGNYFSDRMLGRPEKVPSMVFDASEGDSQSFFAREPQSLMMMSSAVSPGHKYLPKDVNHLDEMH